MTSDNLPAIAPFTQVGLQIPNFTFEGLAPDQLFEAVATAATTAERSGFDTIFVMDHFFQLAMLGTPDEPMFEAYTLLGALAARTTTARLATLVTGVTYRNPAVLAKAMTTLDVISRGRAMLGIGAAWYELEHRSLGVEFPPLRMRFELLEDALRICRAMFTERQATVAGTHHSIDAAWNVPTPLRPGGPPILVGGSGERKTFRLAAEHADELNIISTFPELPGKLAALRGHLDALGKPHDAVRTSFLGTLVVGHTDAEATERLTALLAKQGVADPAALLADPARRAAHLGRTVVGDPDSVAGQVRELLAAGLDGVVFNMPLDAREPAQVELAGRLLREVVDEHHRVSA